MSVNDCLLTSWLHFNIPNNLHFMLSFITLLLALTVAVLSDASGVSNASNRTLLKTCVITKYVLALQSKYKHFDALSFQPNNTSTTLESNNVSYCTENYENCQFEYPTIHGLWPDPEASCTECTNEVFAEEKISISTLEDMKKYWPTCMESNTNEQFWDHEWSKVSLQFYDIYLIFVC